MNKKLIAKTGGIVLSIAMAMSVPMLPTAVGLSSVLMAAEQTTTSTEQIPDAADPTTIPTDMESVPQETIPAQTSTEETTPSTDMTATETTPPATETTKTPEETSVPTETTTAETPFVEESVTDPVTAFVNRCYEIALGRTADAAGREYWRSGLAGHSKTAIETAYGFLFSTEYTTRSSSNETFVNDLYRLMLGRNADPTGKANWLSELSKGSSRQQIFAGFANSVEFRGICDSYGIVQGYYSASFPLAQSSQITAFALRMYTECLGRYGDNAGISDWTRQLIEGRNTGVGVAYGFFFSPEFLNMNLKPRAFAERLYRTMLGRNADEGGLRDWELRLKSGESMESVFAGFANSEEFKGICNAYGISRGTYAAPSQNTHRSASDPEMLGTNGVIYALDPRLDGSTSIAADCPRSVKIPIVGYLGTPVYEITGGDNIQIDANGLVTPKSNDEGFRFGISTIKITVDGKTFKYTVQVANYAVKIMNDTINAFVASSINTSMTTRQKAETVLTYVGNFRYDEGYHMPEQLVVTGGGDKYAAANLARLVFQSMGIACRVEYPYFGDHDCELIFDMDGAPYSAYFGDEFDPTSYYLLESVEEFLFYYDEMGGSVLYQYNGFDTIVNIPSTGDYLPVTTIASETFAFIDSIREINVPGTVETIATSAFKDCSGLVKVTINGSKMKEIGSQAFRDCENLETVSLPTSLLVLGAEAFMYCGSLQSITIPAGVTVIKDSTFYACDSLTSVVLPENLTDIEPYAFAFCTNVEKIVLPSKTATIGSNAFWACFKMEEVVIPPSVTSISLGAFKDCTVLTICGATGSKAQTYASSSKIPFRVITF